MPSKFVPRQRKHKVIARQKALAGRNETITDSNAAEHTKSSKAEIQEKKRQIKEDLRKEGKKLNSRKAKRLEKYLETKLRKDENRDLIRRLASAKSDTSLYHSSSKLGQSRQTKRQRLERILKNQQAGLNIDVNGDNYTPDNRFSTEDEVDTVSSDEPIQKSDLSPIAVQNSLIKIGVGLKRPLELNDDGRPILKKRKRRGGIISKVSLRHQDHSNVDSEWNGFSTDSDMSEIPENLKSDSDYSETDTENKNESKNSDSVSGDSIEESSDSSDESDEVDGTGSKERYSAFKVWATQQINEAIGFQPSTINNVTDEQNVLGFKPRAPEEDPLPEELKITKNTTRKSYSVTLIRPKDILEKRLLLPVVSEEQRIMEAIHNNSTVVICGATGSGKTTQIPQFLFEAGYGSPESSTPGMIGITQPRRVAAVSMAKRVSEEMGDHHKKVAYQIRFEGTVSSETAIKFMTDGVLLREIAQDIALRNYSAVIIDEAHERSVNTDILIGMLSRIVKLREEMAIEDPLIKPLKLVIMSATLRVSDFTENTTLFPSPPPVLKVEGRQYPVTCHFARKTSHNYIDEAFVKISKGHKKLPPGGFLVFLTSQNEIHQLSQRLKETFHVTQSTLGSKAKISGKEMPTEIEEIDFGDVVCDYDEDDDGDEDDNGDEIDINLVDKDFDIGEEAETGPLKMHILPLYSLLPTKEQLKVFEPTPLDSRLVVLATNIAETSLTIPGVRYVFDCGRVKERKFDKTTGVQSFEVGWISKASAQQRAGRAGRTNSGHCYRLYSSAVYERDFAEVSEPEILRMPIEGLVLQLKAMNLQHIVNFPFPTPPERQMLEKSEKLLQYLSAISSTGKITAVGSTMSIFPLSPRFSRILLVGHLHDCLPYTIALVAGLSVSGVFLNENQVAPAAKLLDKETHLTNSERIEEDLRVEIVRKFRRVQKGFCFLDEKSDAIKLLQAVGEFAHQPTEAWCHSHFVQFKALKETLHLRRQLTDLLRINIDEFAALKYEEKLNPPSQTQVKMLKQMIAAGFIDQVAIRADLSPNPPGIGRKPTRATDVPYLTLFSTNTSRNEGDNAVFIHPESPLAHLSPQECPEYIVYSYLQRAVPSTIGSERVPKTRMHSLTDITGKQLTALTKGTPLLHYGKPLRSVQSKTKIDDNMNVRECWVIPYLRPEGAGSIGWPLPACKVTQKKIPGLGWTVV
ncbi:putative ATP-dependent RNA helicase PB1A10.06c [Golovinomyces cichoracearum]|uniref:RNA helicase n=1 Tax=Golovinomyces cichoracearum TaxID=62708 RepID=A0A420HFY3_9PEZI|nr:putative ATP-dependent RNA helicase PB1A10.06c [Golovinomyces cichoracearum]